MTHLERMTAGQPYWPGDAELRELAMRCRELIHQFNQLAPRDDCGRDEILRKLLGKCGSKIYIEGPFHCDYGFNIEAGEKFYANFNLVILDVVKVIIGDNVMFGPNVAIYTPTHPLHWEERNTGWEYGKSVRIGNNVWIGGNAVINPGVTIGENVVVGSGSVVTRDIPSGTVAAGNPARVIRTITDEDRRNCFPGSFQV